MTDKIILLHRGRLENKYGRKGVERIRRSLDDLIVSDRELRALSSIVVAVDSEDDCSTPVIDPQSDFQFKKAVDASFARHRPDYILIVGGPECFPFYNLRNPVGASLEDPEVFSDLPYASAGRRGRYVNDYLECDRVVGRLPDVVGDRDPDFLCRIIAIAARHEQRSQEDYCLEPLCVSAERWRSSTQESAENIFNNDRLSLQTCPQTFAQSLSGADRALVHFLNCHGASSIGAFFGEDLTGSVPDDPVITADEVSALGDAPRTVAAECCYGAGLFAPGEEQMKPGRLPIANAYLDGKAIAFLASTNIAYGPATGNGAADLMTQWFLGFVVEGRSIGAASLKARQRFVFEEDMSDPINLKTLGQFVLYGDPSQCPVKTDRAGTAGMSPAIEPGIARKRRRAIYIQKASSFPKLRVRFHEPMPLPADGLVTNYRNWLAEHELQEFETRMIPIDVPQVFFERGRAMEGQTHSVLIGACTPSASKSRPDMQIAAGGREKEIVIARVVNDRITAIRHYLPRGRTTSTLRPQEPTR